ncbi:SpdD-like protein [Streptomyces sp. NBC_01283]|uniref:SpdD-like protein n=1 Tax=Streptomyces sp. NBC_01283 TaxID=2903812 RepID=UPI00352CCCA8|nr:SpdD-like protein [Streptomyces sp. NBC_01283]
MLKPHVPVNETPTGEIIPVITTIAAASPQHHISAPCACAQHAPAPQASARPAVQLTPGALVTVVVGGTAAVLVVGAVLVSMLLAVAITAGSLAIVALVIRSLMNGEAKRSR